MSEQPLIQLRNVEKRFNGVHALHNVDLTLHAGQMLALLGHNGAGKTTLMKIILGLLHADSGDVQVLGAGAGQHQAAIGYVPENVSFYPALSGRETLCYFARLKGLSRRDAKVMTEQLLETVKLDSAASNRPVKTYSKGMKQRLGLAQSLLPSTRHGNDWQWPKLLILDEPTVGLDPIATADFYDLLAGVQSRGCGVIICTHVLPGLERFIDQTLVLNQGKVIAHGSLESLQERANLPVNMFPKGLNGSLKTDPRLQPYLGESGQLRVPSAQKLEVLQHLMQQQALVDVEVQSPTLPQLYQYLINEADQEVQHDQ